MILKEEIKKKKLSFNFNKFLFIYFLSTLIVGIILIIFIFQSYGFKKAKAKYLDILSKAGRYEYIYLPNIVFKALKSNFNKSEKIDLEIKFDNSLILENVRKESIERGFLPITDNNPRVKFNLISNGEKYSGDIRLKGERKVHFAEKEKSSYKITLDKNKYYLGLKKFSLQKPRIRNYIHEWIFHQMAKDFNIIKLKYEFLDLSINGEDKGLYVLEEGFGKELIERNKRRNGPIFGLNEELSLDQVNPVFEIYNKNYWAQTENKNLVNNASQKLRDFFNNKISLEDVFDIEKWAAYFAVVDMTSTYHGAFLKSVKLYYNPINGLFEPIPFDGHRLKPNYHKYNLDYDDRILLDIVDEPASEEEVRQFLFVKKFFYKENGDLNSLFYNLYIDKLNTISSKKYLDNFLSKNLRQIKKINSHIYADYFYYDNSRNYGIGLYYFLISDFFNQSKNIQNKIKIKKKIQIITKGNSKFLVKNYYKNYGVLIAEKLICNRDNQITEIEVNKILNNFSDTAIKIFDEEIKSTECTHINFIDKYNKNSILLKIDHINSEHFYNGFKNFKLEILGNYFTQVDKNLFLKSEEIKIDQNLYIPKGFKIIIKPGQKILLTNNAFIISNSPWVIGGEDKATIISGEKNNLGGGILIGDTNELSTIQNTKISYLKGYNINLNSEYLIFGSVNFHQTNVEIKDVYFTDIFSEDAINIIRSNFKIQHVEYKNIFSDAIDIDFSDGEINTARFMNINNDAIDFSGSNVIVYDSYFNNVNDKLISAGERSKINISKIKAINSHAGIVSKDGSDVHSSDINFDGVQIPFAAYQKKKEYNYGNLFVKNYDIDNFSVRWIKDKGSKIIINDVPIEVETKKILLIINEKKLSLLE